MPRDRRSPSPPRRSRSPHSSTYSEKHRSPEASRYPSPHYHDERPRDSRRYDGYDVYEDRGHYRPRADSRLDSRAWTRRDEPASRRPEGHHDHYAPYPPRHEYNRPPSRESYHSYRPVSPQITYRPVSPPRPSTRAASPRPPLSPPRTRAHSPPPPPPPPTTSPPPPPPPDSRLIPRNAPLPPPPSSLPPRPPAPMDIHSPPPMAPVPNRPAPPPEVRKDPDVVHIGRRPPPPRRSDGEEEAAYGRTFKGCGNQQEYQITTKLGEGTFGEVHKAVHTATGRAVALKRILMHNEKEGMPVTALREIKIIKALNHPCIVNILDMFVVRSTAKDPLSVYMVFPYMDHDLAGLLENERVKLQPSHIKLYMKQLLEGTEYMHRNHILHRDMKAANLLISNSGSLLIADFGLARAFDSGDNPNRANKERKYTNCVVTRWYRPPELLLGARQYGGEVDMWGIGCVLGEMFMRRPILPGTSDLDQLEKIWILCGSPNQHSWPNFDSLPGCEGIKRFSLQPRKLKPSYEHIGKETCDLLDRLLTCNPRDRITASAALDHDYFWTDPMPADPKTLPVYEASHEFDKRGHRQQQQQHHHQQQQQQQQQHANGPPTHAHLHQADPQRQYRAPPPNSVPPPHMNGNTAPNPNNWGRPSNPHQQGFNKRLPPRPGGPPPPHGQGHGAPPPGQGYGGPPGHQQGWQPPGHQQGWQPPPRGGRGDHRGDHRGGDHRGGDHRGRDGGYDERRGDSYRPGPPGLPARPALPQGPPGPPPPMLRGRGGAGGGGGAEPLPYG
ncbi:kinase-like domain-containing protein [Mycena rebaudengoi]|nr:kinase-like domain-containing protein [Mycena rebaudengoi]